MGEYFMYANLDRMEYFDIDALGGATKSGGIGKGLGARALGLLLTSRGGETNEESLVGSWAATRVVAVGDYIEPNLFGIATATSSDPKRNLYALAEETFKNIASAIAMMLLEHDGPDELIDSAKRNDYVFVLLGELALVHRTKMVETILSKHFGPQWKKEYAKKIPPP